MAERSRRDTKTKVDKLAEYKRAREGGKRVWKPEESSTIYDEVSDDQYKSIVKGRLQKDDFVVDDGVDGYMDNGMDDWNGEDEDRVDSDEEFDKKKKKSAKNKKPTTKAKPKAPPPAPAPSISAYRPVVSADQEEDFMASLLGNMEDIPATVPAKGKSRKRKPSPDYDYDRSSSPIPVASTSYRNGSAPYDNDFADTSSDGIVDDLPPSSDDFLLSPKKKARLDGAITPATEKIGKLHVHSDPEEYDDVDMSAFMDIDDEDLTDVKPKVKKEDVPHRSITSPGTDTKPIKKQETEAPSWLSVYDSLSVQAHDDTLGPLGSKTSSSVASSNISALEPDGSLRFFWLDYLELDGKIYFIGKLKDKPTGTWVSCCVTVEGIQRNLFVLPRAKRVEEDDEGGLWETDVVPSSADVIDDFQRVRKHAGIKTFRAKPVKRKYAFGETDIPRGETEWLKVVYPFSEPQIKSDITSPNIARIFGTGTSAFELLVLKRKIMGPCWLKIKSPQVENKGVSWCKLEVTVTDPKDVNPFSETDPEAPKDMPPLNVMSLSVRTIVNHKENKREIVCITSRIWANLQIEDPTPPEKLPCSVHTFVRPLDRFPPNFESHAKANGKGNISPVTNERMLLNKLLVTIHQSDPDVIIGHEFLGVSLDVLLHRMRDLKAEHYSRIGRFRRTKWPTVGRQGTNLKFLNGRMLCDLTSDAAKGMISSTTWSMTEMCKTHLKSVREDIDPDETAAYMDGTVSSPDRLLKFVRHCELDAHYQMAIAAKVQILPLTRQLTNLAGNSWNKTLNGGRAERNEYILLHEFHRLKYICPDKTYGKKAAAVKVEAQDDDYPDGAKPTTKGKRDKYKGGLVFEPKKGLWDKIILVMDFNSLYPSIIQEYNIDFTTVDRVEDEDGEEKIPEPPASDVAQGVLPRLIAALVGRRRQVKALMKDRSISHAKLLQYEIKQQAYKLTANSMYGCLGFEYSRFYARPLAALTTFKGREILTHTRELAESLQLDVVYGDTDSVFVNSNVTDLAEALKISAEFKRAVNDCYKLLEIDLDGVFQRLLLLQKKKYAAIKVEEGTRTSTEIKGLDMKRREYCALSKNVSQYVLDQILSGEPTEIVVENIHEYLTTVRDDVRGGKIKLEDFIVYKRLGKNPEDYPDAKSQPHVQVALRMKALGRNARAGDVIPYVFCLAEGEETAKTAQADRAKIPDEVRRAGSDCKIDYEHYLANQILPPIERLCEPIEGTDRARLAECLGLDPGRFRNPTSGESTEISFSNLDSQLSDKERFKNAEPFLVRCRNCEGQLPFVPFFDRESSILLPSGPTCPACQTIMGTPSLQTQLEVQIRAHIAKYYEGWVTCDDPTCGHRTRMMGVYGRRCLRPGCRGTVAFEYSDAELYNQLRYFAYLFDAEKAKKNAKKEDIGAVDGAVMNNAAFLQSMTDTVEKYLDQCGRRWVELSGLFSFMKV
ncbi:hypothetical protein PLICRDRAFT_298164 [Plicaturopsis crispa FD-325 SS-3]|nr:hypothetical protein PLICRDRAFT_298164 [Plicaturopsis crispa FD-325 SS-3]